MRAIGRNEHFADVIMREKPVIGVIHLLPLPGSPRFKGSLGAILRRAFADAEAYIDGGISWIIIENYGDAPYSVRVRDPAVLASFTVVARELMASFGKVRWGLNLLRNSAPEALAVAYAVGARYIRVNALVEAISAPEGILYPVARELAEIKGRLGAWNIGVLADIHVKHGTPIAPRSLEDTARDAVERGGADAIIVSGSRTGAPPSPSDLAEARRAGAPVLVGSGVTPGNIDTLSRLADGFIIGTYFKKQGVTTNPVDRERVAWMMSLLREGSRSR